ncbi:MAG TPA: tRNA (guanosine(46)-N7)-methyltransferase TrmB [Candidatus Ozemobacteraceae bacterium]|nr:tRNA (guanosine(46)-N7)-methyltransferase TrmB [Candidatus Ozemobacteraceae bacterium]
MRVSKLERYRQNATFPNLLEPPITDLLQRAFPLRGKWNAEYFRREGAISLEIGCGWGEFSLGLARCYPEKNVLGLDSKGARVWHGARTALETGLTNLGFIRVEGEGLEGLFASGELREIWITFPTPYLRKPDKMLIAPAFLARYRTLLGPGGVLRLLTDVAPLGEYARTIWPLCGFEMTVDTLWDGPCGVDETFRHEEVCTRFQARAIAQRKSIRYLCAVPVPGEVKPIPPETLRNPWMGAAAS